MVTMAKRDRLRDRARTISTAATTGAWTLPAPRRAQAATLADEEIEALYNHTPEPEPLFAETKWQSRVIAFVLAFAVCFVAGLLWSGK